MRKRISKSLGVAGALLLAGHLLAGGFYLSLGNPEASPEARKLHAVLTVTATGCHDPATAKVTGTAIGIVNGVRREIPLTLEPLPATGMFALPRQWPQEGRWVIQLVGRNGEQFTNSLMVAGPGGLDRYHARVELHEFAAADIDALLK